MFVRIASTPPDLSASVPRVNGQAREQAIRGSEYLGRQPTASSPHVRADRGRGGKRQLRLVPAPVSWDCAAQAGIGDAPALPRGPAASDWACHDHQKELARWNHQRPLVFSEPLREAVRGGPELDDRVRAVAVSAALLRPRPAHGNVHAQAGHPNDPAAGRRRCHDGCSNQSSRRRNHAHVGSLREPDMRGTHGCAQPAPDGVDTTIARRTRAVCATGSQAWRSNW